MPNVNWEEVAEYVSAGNLASIKIDDFTTVLLEVVYINGNSNEQVQVSIACFDCSYVDLRRRADHEPGAGMILEADLHIASPLIEALFAHKLESKAGCLLLENNRNEITVKHLEIIGEISVNILCKDMSYKLS